MKVAVVGSRHFQPVGLVRSFVMALAPYDIVVSGHGGNVDLTAEEVADERTAKFGAPKPIIYPAKWKHPGDRTAGPIRNELIAKECDRLVAFRMPGKSDGTDDVIAKAKRYRKPVVVFDQYGKEIERWEPGPVQLGLF